MPDRQFEALILEIYRNWVRERQDQVKATCGAGSHCGVLDFLNFSREFLAKHSGKN